MTASLTIGLALGSAALFGDSTPFIKLLTGDASSLVLAGMLYLGGGMGLAAMRLLRARGWKTSGLSAAEWPWFVGAIGFGGILGPSLLIWGLMRTGASTSASESRMSGQWLPRIRKPFGFEMKFAPGLRNHVDRRTQKQGRDDRPNRPIRPHRAG